MTVISFIIALSIIVAVHEYGHYIIGRWSGIKAQVFSLGFGPVLVQRTDKHGTIWQIAALPFGGYVKFLGDTNVASGQSNAALEAVPEADRRHTMAGAPLWARTLTVAAGPVFNFILAIAIFWGVGLVNGRVSEPLTIGQIKPLPVNEFQLQPGDRVLAIENLILSDDGMGDLIDRLPEQPLLNYKVQRDDQQISVKGPYPFPPLVAGLVPQSAAYEAGVEQGDVIIAANERDVHSFRQFKDIVETTQGAPINLQVWRGGGVVDLTLTPRHVDEPDGQGGFVREWRVGIVGGLAFEPAVERIGVFAAFNDAIVRVWSIITGSVSGLYHMITGAISSCNLSGPIGIAKASGAMASQGAQSFISFIAVLSVAVGFLNLFPIPVLDGGHLVFYAYEGVFGKPPPERILNIFMGIGIALILALMVFAISNDLFCP